MNGIVEKLRRELRDAYDSGFRCGYLGAPCNPRLGLEGERLTKEFDRGYDDGAAKREKEETPRTAP